MTQVPLTLTIAGSETTGGAGMQADLKTFEEYGCHGMVALTSLVTMAPATWEHQVFPVPLEVLQQQLDTVFAGKKTSAMKTGMLPGAPVISLVARAIREQALDNVVIDPVMVCKGDDTQLNMQSADALREVLVPLADVATPNLFEAGVLSGLGALQTVEDMKKAARLIRECGAKCVVVKGGKALKANQAIDVFFDGSRMEVLTAGKVDNTYNQGAGCSFSAAVAAGLACGMPVFDAVVKAKAYVRAAIEYGFAFNQFTGPVYHAAYRLKQ